MHDYEVIREQSKDIAALKQQRDELAAENAGLREKLEARCPGLVQIQEPAPALAPRLDDAWKAFMLDGQPLARDKDGIGYHPALPDFDEGVKYTAFFAALGIELKGGMAENEMDSEAYEAMTENGLTDGGENYNAWTPMRPGGESWNLVAVFDTEDGPACWWMREKPYQSPSAAKEPQPAPAAQPVAWRYQTPTGWHATTDASAALRVKQNHPIEPLFSAPQPQAEDARDAEIALPKTRDVVRIGDIHPKDHIRLEFGFQNDVYVSIRDGYNYASIEFRKPGGDYSGCRSIRTYAALIALSTAMEADNAASPSSNPRAQNDEIAAQAAKGETE